MPCLSETESAMLHDSASAVEAVEGIVAYRIAPVKHTV